MSFAIAFTLAVGLLALAVALRGRHERRDRRLRDDLLKQFHVCERQRRQVQLEALAGTLGVSVRRAHGALAGLLRDGFVRSIDGQLSLTPRGRETARGLVRKHRLIETYLAERRGLPLARLHRTADRLEHRLSRRQIDVLDRVLGHPVRDPHGDPIPNGKPLSAPHTTLTLERCPAGSVVEVAHVEDEPDELVAGLLAAGIVPGARLEVVEHGDDGLVVAVAGRGRVPIDPPSAGQVDVTPMAGDGTEAPPVDAIVSLDELPFGEAGRIVLLTSELRGEPRRRLLDLGFTPGTIVRPVMHNALGRDPTGYLVRQSKVALRREHARHVLLTPVAKDEDVTGRSDEAGRGASATRSAA